MNSKEIRETIDADPELFLAMAQEMAKSNPGIRKIMDTLNQEAMHERAKAMSDLTNSSDREVTKDVALAALESLDKSSQYRREREAFHAGEKEFGYVAGNIPMASIVTLIEYARQQSVNDNPDLYVLQDSRSMADGKMLFWAKNARGYTTELDQAHRFTRESALAQQESRSTDIPHRVGDLAPASGEMLANAAQVSANRSRDTTQQGNTAPEPDWNALEGRRIGELSVDEHADAYELWMRNNITHGHQNYEMIRFLLDRLDQSRGKVSQVLAPSDNRTLDADLDNGETEDVDLFEDIDALPDDIRAICNHYSVKMANGDEDPNQLCRNFLREAEAAGYTFEYGLDAEPYGLQKRPTANNSVHTNEQSDLTMGVDDDPTDGPGLQ